MIKAIIFDCFGVLLTDGLQLLYDELFATDPEAAKKKAIVAAALARARARRQQGNNTASKP